MKQVHLHNEFVIQSPSLIYERWALDYVELTRHFFVTFSYYALNNKYCYIITKEWETYDFKSNICTTCLQ
ncbi:hypothetical protein SATMO3_39590 [Sporomusa aerivorans]